jgi:hypothetical protein
VMSCRRSPPTTPSQRGRCRRGHAGGPC